MFSFFRKMSTTVAVAAEAAAAAAAAEVEHLNYWLENLKRDSRLSPQQFLALEKAILLAISMFEKSKGNPPFHDLNYDNQATADDNDDDDDVKEPMEIDKD